MKNKKTDWKKKYDKEVETRLEYESKCYQTKKRKEKMVFWWVASLFLISTCWLLLIPDWNFVDENSFCLDKINTYYPEYNFQSAVFSNGECVGTYYPVDSESRDGLNPKGAEEKTMVFELTNQTDIDYLATDDKTMECFQLAGLLAVIGLVVIWVVCTG